jgi:opacity protein-like surface antigen
VVEGVLKTTTYTIEGFYGFDNSTAFTPYIKAGLGLADNSYSAKLGGAGISAFDAFDGNVDGYYDAYADNDSTEFTWNIGAGVNYQITKTMSLYTEYQYIEFGDVQTGQDAFTDGFKIDSAASHEFLLCTLTTRMWCIVLCFKFKSLHVNQVKTHGLLHCQF